MTLVYAKSFNDLQKQAEAMAKEKILKEGIRFGFNLEDMTYTNRENDSWLRIRKDKQLLAYDAAKGKSVAVAAIAEEIGE